MAKKYLALAVMSVLVMSAAQAKAEGKDGVAAVVNGEKITVAEIRKAYNENPQIKEKVPFDEFYGKAVEVFINGKLVYQAAVADKVLDSAEYKDQIKLAKEEIARKVYLEKQVDKKVTKDQINKLYDEYKKSFKAEKEIKAKHILVDSEAKAKEVIKKLKDGQKFDKLAKEYSKEPADLGYFTKEVMVPEFANAAFDLGKGKYSQTPVKTQFGYHVILVEDIRDAKPQPLNKIEPQLKAMMTQGAIAGIFEDLSNKAKVTKYDLKGNVESSPAVKAPAKKNDYSLN